jgi:hypothetical protein
VLADLGCFSSPQCGALVTQNVSYATTAVMVTFGENGADLSVEAVFGENATLAALGCPRPADSPFHCLLDSNGALIELYDDATREGGKGWVG